MMLFDASFVSGRSLLEYMYPTIFFHSSGSSDICCLVMRLELSSRALLKADYGGACACELCLLPEARGKAKNITRSKDS